MYQKIGIVFIVFLFFIFGCSKKTTSPNNENPEQSNAPTLPQGISEPITHIPQNTPFEAQIAYAFVNIPHVTLELFVDSLTHDVGGNVQWNFQNNKYTWKYQTDTNSVTIQATINDNTQHWIVTIDGRWYHDNEVRTVHNFTFIDATFSADFKNGEVTLYAPNYTDYVFKETWQTDASGMVTQTLFLGGDKPGKVVVVNNPDGSGSLKSYGLKANSNTYILLYEANWNADGSGNWKSYDENGNLTGQGSWT